MERTSGFELYLLKCARPWTDIFFSDIFLFARCWSVFFFPVLSLQIDFHSTYCLPHFSPYFSFLFFFPTAFLSIFLPGYEQNRTQLWAELLNPHLGLSKASLLHLHMEVTSQGEPLSTFRQCRTGKVHVEKQLVMLGRGGAQAETAQE